MRVMHAAKVIVLGACIAVPVPSPARAQSSGWTYEGTLYLFMPRTETTLATPSRTFDSSLSFSDALANLDFAFMGAFAAENGKFSILADYLYNDLSFGNTTPGPAFSGLDTSVKTQILNGYVAYRVHDSAKVAIDVAGGFRWFDARASMTLQPGAAPGRAASVSSSWTDPVVGARARFKLSDTWSSTAFADYGGFSSDSETWQALLTFDYALTDKWLLRGGYRHISVDHTDNGTRFEFSQSGPVLGAVYRF
ncbi:porin family protein [Chachezhania sediminis]|uniref:porin family protein n=1 Tax=Chachezhania sediminis TaxID=2599291 RepID=UPI001E5D3D42|nr:porin family protein [Chachezhania sediminis]